MKFSIEDKIVNLNGVLYKCSIECGIYDNGLKIFFRILILLEVKGMWFWFLDGVLLICGFCLRLKLINLINGFVLIIGGIIIGKLSIVYIIGKLSII